MNWKIRPNASISVTALLTTLIIITTISTIQISSDQNLEVFAKEYSQTTSQTDQCGNGSLPLNIFCSNQDSQIQGDENVVTSTQGQSIQPSDSHSLIGPDVEQQDKTVAPTTNSTSGTEVDNSDNVNGHVNNEFTSSNEDPTLMVLPCCDEMPGDSASTKAHKNFNF
jgi:hypothetical protein